MLVDTNFKLVGISSLWNSESRILPCFSWYCAMDKKAVIPGNEYLLSTLLKVRPLSSLGMFYFRLTRMCLPWVSLLCPCIAPCSLCLAFGTLRDAVESSLGSSQRWSLKLYFKVLLISLEVFTNALNFSVNEFVFNHNLLFKHDIEGLFFKHHSV